MRCKFIESQSINDARRLYNKSFLFVKPFEPHQTSMHVTQLLNEDEKIKQSLPADLLKLTLNWCVMEINYLKQLTKGINTDSIVDTSIQSLLDGSMIKLSLYKFL
jgi:hypothetical protein